MDYIFAFISGSTSCDGLHLDSFPFDNTCRDELILMDSVKFSLNESI